MVTPFRIRIPDHFATSFSIAELGILGDLLAFFHMNSQHSESDPAGTRIRICIIPEIWIRIGRDWTPWWMRFALCECSLVYQIALNVSVCILTSRFVVSHHAVLLINLCIALIVANVIFLSGVDKTWHRVRTYVRRTHCIIVVPIHRRLWLNGGFWDETRHQL